MAFFTAAWAERLRREYLNKEKTKGAPRPVSAQSACLNSTDQGGFSFDGHRLSSLYRGPLKTILWLTNPYVFSLQKYSYSDSATDLSLQEITL